MTTEPGHHHELGGTASSGPQGNGLYEAIWALTSELSLDGVLQKVADLSRELVGASYSALGVLGPDGRLVQFITSGISHRGRERIGRPPEGRGVLGVVLRDGKPLRLADLSQHPESTGFPAHHPRMTSFLGVPIVYQGRVLGDLYLTNKIGADEFSPEDETIVTLFAAQAAVAMENARLFENEARRSAQLDALNRVGRDLTRILDLDQLLQRMAEMLQESFNYQNVQVFWVDPGRQTLQVRALVGLLQGRVPSGASQPMGQGIAGWVARNQGKVLCNDVSQDPRYFPLLGFEASAQLAVPVIIKDEVVAVINVDGMEPYAFDEGDAKSLETLADQLAVAIENIRLYRQQQEQAQRWAIVEERERIGRDLHDGVIQSIYAVGLTLEDIAARGEEEPREVPPRIEGVVGDLNQVIADIRGYIMDLRPRELQGRRLDEALQSLTQYLEGRTGVSVTLDVGIDLSSLSERYVVNFWHIFQEAFSNIEKYARARKVTVSLNNSGGDLSLEIADDGVGFDPEQAELGRGYGLPDIKDRAERLGGLLAIETASGRGTRLRIQVPLGQRLTPT
jgi:two-component system, NarL family, sensor histidine kinase DevS